MKLTTLAACILLAAAPAAAPVAALAQGGHGHTLPAPRYGGVVAESSGDHMVELVVRGDQVTAYVSDHDNRPLPSAQLGGKATVLVGGKRQEVPLAPGEGNSLAGKLAVPASGKVTVVLQLTVAGKPTTVRFAVG